MPHLSRAQDALLAIQKILTVKNRIPQNTHNFNKGLSRCFVLTFFSKGNILFMTAIVRKALGLQPEIALFGCYCEQ